MKMLTRWDNIIFFELIIKGALQITSAAKPHSMIALLSYG